MEKNTAVRSTRRFTNFVQSLFAASNMQVEKRTYAKVLEDTGNLVIVDTADIESESYDNGRVTLIPFDSNEEDKIIGQLLDNPRSGSASGEVKNPTSPSAVSPSTVAAIRVRPLGQGDFIKDRRFVQLLFKAGGFLRAIAAADEAKKLEEMLTTTNTPVIQWRAGTHEIWIRRDQLFGCEIDKHEPEKETQLRSQASSDDEQLNVRLVSSDGITTDVVVSSPPAPGRRPNGNDNRQQGYRGPRRNDNRNSGPRNYDQPRDAAFNGNWGGDSRGNGYGRDNRGRNDRYSAPSNRY